MTMRRVGIVRRSLAIALLLLLLPIGAVVDAQAPRGTELRDVSVTTQPDAVMITVKTTGEVKYRAELVDRPYRLVLDFDDTSYGWRKAPLAVETEPLKQIRGSQFRRGVARVVVELTRKVGYAIREERDGLAIVIPTSTSARLAEPTTTTSSAPKSSKTAAPIAAAATPSRPAETKPAQPKAASRSSRRSSRACRPSTSSRATTRSSSSLVGSPAMIVTASPRARAWEVRLRSG